MNLARYDLTTILNTAKRQVSIPYATSIYYSVVTVLKGLLITFGIILITILFSSSKSVGPIDFPEKTYKTFISLLNYSK